MLNSPLIVDSPMILFLGAGASAPLGKPLMAEFVERIAGRITDESQKRMLGYLRGFRGDDLESILSELDTIIDLDYASTVEGMVAVGTGSSHFTLSRTTARYLRANLKHEIIREYRNVDASKVNQLYAPLFDFLFRFLDSGKCLPIFTTNYDPAIEEFCRLSYPDYQLTDGFGYDPAARQNYWERSVFDGFKPDSIKRNLVLFKLHGSVDWLSVKSTGKIRRGQAMYDMMDSDAYENVLIYPATRKIATDDPFYTGYEYFERCCERARVCLAVGYSFRDYDALTRLRGAVSMNENLLLLLVDPRSEAILKTIPIPDKRKAPLSGKFSEGIAERLEVVSTELREQLGLRTKSEAASESG